MYEVERAEGARTALFTFGSFTNPGRAEPSYAFMNTVLRMRRVRKVVCDSYYFKAKENDWYFSGFSGSASFSDSCRELANITSRYDRVVFLGNSMGAYAALAFGLHLNADLVLAFSPQTRFDQAFCDSIGEKRWRAEFQAMRTLPQVDEMAIRSIWPDPCRSLVRLFVGGDCSQDVAYAMDLKDKPGSELTILNGSGHDLVHDLRASGELEQLIYDGLSSGI